MDVSRLSQDSGPTTFSQFPSIPERGLRLDNITRTTWTAQTNYSGCTGLKQTFSNRADLIIATEHYAGEINGLMEAIFIVLFQSMRLFGQCHDVNLSACQPVRGSLLVCTPYVHQMTPYVPGRPGQPPKHGAAISPRFSQISLAWQAQMQQDCLGQATGAHLDQGLYCSSCQITRHQPSLSGAGYELMLSFTTQAHAIFDPSPVFQVRKLREFVLRNGRPVTRQHHSKPCLISDFMTWCARCTDAGSGSPPVPAAHVPESLKASVAEMQPPGLTPISTLP